MTIDWRRLLTELRVDWRDRGQNVSRGHISICCPWCGTDDIGFHLGVSEEYDGYHCFRHPRQHSGTNLARLLIALGVSRLEAVKLLNEFTEDRPARPVAERQDSINWDRFESARYSPHIVDYLLSRDFDDPERVIQRYDLRYALVGKWAARALLPFRDSAGTVNGWTGRALHKHMQPRYLTEEAGQKGHVYLPRAPRELMVLVEGPLDALKLAAATEHLPVSVCALLGKEFSPPRMLRLTEVLAAVGRVYVCLDADASFSDSTNILNELKICLLRGRVERRIMRLRLPSGVKDPGELTYVGVCRWLNQELCLSDDP